VENLSGRSANAKFACFKLGPEKTIVVVLARLAAVSSNPGLRGDGGLDGFSGLQVRRTNWDVALGLLAENRI